MLARCLPLATAFDSTEDPPGSIDPLGTVAGAEQLADVLFSGMTARMWRARHLTFAALAAHVAEQAPGATGDPELRLESRLALERLFVSAVARSDADDSQWKRASRRLPGIGLARRAWAAKDQPLGRRTFLKGQAINGPFGVVSRLARHLEIIDDDNRLGRNGEELLRAWAADQGLPGILDAGAKSLGASWIRQFARRTARDQAERWPSAGWDGWKNLAERLRPDAIGGRERKLICKLLIDEREPRRRRCMELLQHRDAVAAYRNSSSGGRGQRDREILYSSFRRLLKPATNPVDRTIYYVTDLIDAYEQVASSLEIVMRTLCSALVRRGGRAARANILVDRALKSGLRVIQATLQRATPQLQARLIELAEHPVVQDKISVERFRQLLDDAQAAVVGQMELVECVLDRHGRVQRQKKKGVWIDVAENRWTLMPGFGNAQDDVHAGDGTYIHPFRVANADSILADLKMVPAVETSDAKET